MDMEMRVTEDGSYVVMEDGEWKILPSVIGQYIVETMPAPGFDMNEWKVAQTYTHVLATALIDPEKAKTAMFALEAIWPDTIQRYVEYMGWNQESSLDTENIE